MWFSIDRHDPMPMFRQVFEAYRGAILSGRLPAGTKLPSTRELAGELDISRNVILEAYEQLLAEGYIQGRPGAGTYVAEGACMTGFAETPAASDAKRPDDPAVGWRAEDEGISFRTGLPAVDRFPLRQWGASLQRAAADAAPADLGYGDSAGWPALRRALADHLWRTRGAVCRPEQIIVTNGAVQALDLISRLLLTEGDAVLLEDPTNEDLKTILTSTGAALTLIPADDAGLDTGRLTPGLNPKCVYVTPSHQFPLGGVLPIQRRIELVSYIRRGDGYIVEDDYDSEFRFDGPPVHSLQSLDPERVIYIGTFSKTLFPALRIGYMVLPEPLVAGARARKRLSDFQTPILDQLALTRFMEEGHLRAHIQKMKKLYQRKRQCLVQAMQAHWTGGYRICGQAVGLHLAVAFDSPFPADLARRLEEAGVYAGILSDRSLLLGYGHLGETEIGEGVRRLGAALGRERLGKTNGECYPPGSDETRMRKTTIAGSNFGFGGAGAEKVGSERRT
ncbi:MocR-like pyridoxine biosynthesis transcription factor PdxR [Cohnella nanjingensis]|uniref:PLP-dependent aminotransferase family protein n=1 Tax=Cohnella nanjingensis TaxID=1387779 RepID=A0A7X0VF04_9BACL|nr:PLP-dependent aminotransferase family protein [Cohnella nanjingensis]MBB6671306.1 PLP-dependent aminotransferase family protein [Cohnella nanjingensis]